MSQQQAGLDVDRAHEHRIVPGDATSQPRSINGKHSGQVLAVVDRTGILSEFLGATTAVDDVSGSTVTPGPIDALLHPIQGAELSQRIDLGNVTDLRELWERPR